MRVLVIKLGALGDFIQAVGPFQAIRAHHPDAEITLMTTAPFVDLALKLGCFDHVLVDTKPKVHQIGKIRALKKQLDQGRFDRVYDLQTSDRSSFYYRLMRGRPDWSGIAKGCSHPHANPKRDCMHTRDRQAEQLAMAGIDAVPDPDFTWAGDGRALAIELGLTEPFVLLVPGGAAHRPAKRWPEPQYGALAWELSYAGFKPVAVGTSADEEVLHNVGVQCPEVSVLQDKTSILDLIRLAPAAQAAIGNDTGPMHALASAGCPSVVLFSHDSDPALCAPRGPKVVILRNADLDKLRVGEVYKAWRKISGA